MDALISITATCLAVWCLYVVIEQAKPAVPCNLIRARHSGPMLEMWVQRDEEMFIVRWTPETVDFVPCVLMQWQECYGFSIEEIEAVENRILDTMLRAEDTKCMGRNG